MEENSDKHNRDIRTVDSDENKEDNENILRVTAARSMSDVINESTRQAASKYAMPKSYDRRLFDDNSAKIKAKEEFFADRKTAKDPYTGKTLVKKQEEARSRFGDEKYVDHAAETDHVRPLNKLYEEHGNNPWLTTEDLKKIANSRENLKVISRRVNNAKRDKTNTEFAEDVEYLKDKKVFFTDEGQQKLKQDDERAHKYIKSQVRKYTVKNAVKTGHEAGMRGAQDAGVKTLAMSGIKNLVSVIKGEKSGLEAVEDTAKAGGKAAVSGYLVDSTATVVARSLEGSSSKFLQALVKSNIPGNVIAAVTTYGGTFKKFAQGEISTQQCLLELGESGVNLATMGYYAGVGQALIPIPVIGGVIGAFVGSALTSTYFNQLKSVLQQKELEHQERLRVIAECQEAAEQLKKYRNELEKYLAAYFKEYQDCFDDALSNLKFAYQTDNADDLITSANEITNKLGGDVRFETISEFKEFLNSDITDEL